mmetsp:Transcript_11994/g.39400  ORF Transcript_11994/g.39400 Transcript_11994/m.39400 type:complete len:361 (-) Transcript_11994:888-1970(-)
MPHSLRTLPSPLTTYTPGSEMRISTPAAFLCSAYPRMEKASGMPCVLGSTGTHSHPSLTTEASRTTTWAPGAARMVKAPSSVSDSSVMSPSRRRCERRDTETDGDTLFISSSTVSAKRGESEMAGRRRRRRPTNRSGSPCSTFAPASLSSRALASYTAASPAPGDAAYVPFACSFTASSMLFFTGENENQRSKSVNPTLASGGKSFGRSCIMHSSRVGFLKLFLAASAYFGLTNSGIEPPVAASADAYGCSCRMSVLTLPGYGEKPVPSAVSPPVDLSSASSWLYSTLMTTSRPPRGISLQMAPAASPGDRGTVKEFIVRPSRAETPSAAGMALKASTLVSWKKTRCVNPSASKRGSRPD